MDVNDKVRILPESIQLAPPSRSQDDAVTIALRLRLDVQTSRDRVDDLRRQVDLARNGLLPDLDLAGTITFPFANDGNDLGIDGSPDTVAFALGMQFNAPLDRVIERYQLRQAQIRLEQGIRVHRNTRDDVAVSVRSSVRNIERAQFSTHLQRRNVAIAENRRAALQAAPDRASTRDHTEAVNALRRAEDQYDRAARDLQVSILEYLNESGQLRVKPNGELQPLPGMRLQDPSIAGVSGS
jgi:outer membrane protein TolC